MPFDLSDFIASKVVLGNDTTVEVNNKAPHNRDGQPFEVFPFVQSLRHKESNSDKGNAVYFTNATGKLLADLWTTTFTKTRAGISPEQVGDAFLTTFAIELGKLPPKPTVAETTIAFCEALKAIQVPEEQLEKFMENKQTICLKFKKITYSRVQFITLVHDPAGTPTEITDDVLVSIGIKKATTTRKRKS